MTVSKRVLAVSLAALLSAGVSMCATGCRDTDVLKHINHTQSAQTVDQNTDQKYLISNPEASEVSDAVPAVEVDRDAAPTQEKQNIVVYSSSPNSTNHIAKKSLFALDPDYNGLEASDGVRLVASKKQEAVEKEKADEAKEDDSNKDDSGSAVSEKGNGDDSSKEGEKASSKAKAKKAQKGKGGNVQGETEVNTTDTTGKYVDPPKVDSVAAFGQTAVIVQMVGGEGALAAADKTLLSSDFKNVFSDEGATKITKGWSDDGSASKIDVDAIVKSGAQTILVDSGDYQKNLTESDRKALNKAGVTFTVVPKLSNSTYIKQAVTTIGAMFSDSKGIGNQGETENIAADYCAFHDKVVNECIDANGGKLAGTTVYENKNPKASKYAFNSDAKYTLLIDKYDDSAKFSGTYGGSWSPTCDGIGICTYGYGATATSFYIQAGGLINNAAAKGTGNDSGTIPAWQFSKNSMDFKKAKWTYSKNGEFAKTDEIVGSAWDQVLFTTDVNEDGNGVGESFGSDIFPNIIVGTQAEKKKIISNSKKSDGAYHPYGKETSPGGSAFGKLVGKSGICYSSIGVNGADSGSSNLFENGQIDSDAVYVNPAGLFSSWTEGSVESFLEAAWVNDSVEGNETKVDVKQLVHDFYEDFYRYDASSSDVNDILDGD